MINYYQEAAAYIKKINPKSLTVGNKALRNLTFASSVTNINVAFSRYLTMFDVYLNYEATGAGYTSYAVYNNNASVDYRTLARGDQRVGHIVHTVSKKDLHLNLKRAIEYGAGYLYLTDDTSVINPKTIKILASHLLTSPPHT